MSSPGAKQLRQPPSGLRKPSDHPLNKRKITSLAGLAGLRNSHDSPHDDSISEAPKACDFLGHHRRASFGSAAHGAYLYGTEGRVYAQSPGPWSHGSRTMCRAVPASTVRFHQGQRWRT